MNLSVELESDKKAETKDYKGETANRQPNRQPPPPRSKEIAKSQERISGAIAFIDFMDKYHVVIPKIQRLYVQGRPDSYGEKCQSGFASHLVGSVTEEKCLPLDFIYGIESEKEFHPLDGQQRLTTLLLLAWLCGETKKDWVFRYDSRRATECFIEGLLGHTSPKLTKPGDDESNRNFCSDHIKKSDWFLSKWEEDAGIAGMLTMLDSLYCKLLASGKLQFDFSRITFFVNYLDAEKTSYDQIFLKMNSRGKTLTAWENIKAVLDKHAPEKIRQDWQEKLNNTWQESLWKKLGSVEKLDSKMLAVVELALACAGYDKKVTNTFLLTTWLGAIENEKRDEFYDVCSIFFSAIELNDDNISKALIPAWGKSPQLPDFSQDNSETFYKPLLAYYSARQSTANDWMRVAWNIAENAQIKKGNFPSAYQLIKELSTKANHILEFLANDEEKIKSQFAKDQITEERAKARILNKQPSIKPLLEEVEALMRGRCRLAVLNLTSDEKEPYEGCQSRLTTLKTLLTIWNNASKDEETRKKIVMAVVAASPNKLREPISLKTGDDDLRLMLSSRNDETLQKNLIEFLQEQKIKEVSLEEIQENNNDKPKSPECWRRDWRETILKIAGGKDGYLVYQKRLWGCDVKKHSSGCYYLYTGANIPNALPINDYRIEFLTEEEQKKLYHSLGEHFTDVAMNDGETHSGKYENNKELHIYFYSDHCEIRRYGGNQDVKIKRIETSSSTQILEELNAFLKLPEPFQEE